MKTKARILTLLLAVITVMSPVRNVAMAATSYGTSTTTDKTVHASSHTVSDDCAKVTKSAKWTNKDKTEAEITIEVDTNYSETQKRATNTDFIYILDKSNSMGDQVSTDWYTVKNALISKLKYFITDDKSGQTYYKDSGNRVAFATFSSHLFTYTKGGENRVAIQYKRYVDEKNEATSGLSALGQVPDAETAKKYFENGVKTAGASNVKFYSTESELNTVIDGVNHHFPGENTNIDLALSYARYLIDNRTGTEKNRKTYVIFITEGQPFPYDDDERNYYGTGKNEDGTYWDWGPARRSDYAANLHHTKIAEAIRDSGAEIYSIMIDRETTHKSDKGLWSSITTGSTTDDSHLFYIPDNERDIAKAIKDIHNKLAAEIETEASKATSMVVTDKIETEYFKFAGTSAATVCETNIGEATINSTTGEVKWDLGDNLEYGVKGSDGKIPKLTIKIKLKDEDSEGWFNTNENLPNDNQCIFEYANTNIKVQTPWLQRIIAKPKYNVTERWVKKTTGEDLETSNKDTVEEGSVYNVIGKKDLTSMGYKYDSSTTNEKTRHNVTYYLILTITITKNTEIIHYYTPIENYTVTERWVDKTKEKDLETPNKETLEGNSTYTVIGKKDFSSKGYTYNYSTIDEKTVIVTGNLEIIHYYIPEGIEPDSKIIYGTPTVTKTAKWTNNDKTEAEITITVETDKQKNDETKIKDSDIIYIVDRSKTMGNSKFTYSTIRKSIKNNFKHFITGEFVNANNRVALATFNSWLQIYDDGKINSYEYDYTGGKTGIADYKQSDAENDIFTKLENTGVGKFYNTVTEADNALTAFTSKSEGANTNLDYGLLYAKYLLKNRTGTDKDRKAYVVILTDGDPYPYTKYELEKNAGGRLQDYVANQFIYSLVDELKREYGVEFYVVIVDDDDRSHNEVWEYITSEESGATGNKALKEGSALTTESSFNEIHQEIVESMEENIIYADSAYMNLTDMINTDYFEVISTDSSKTCSTNTGSTSISNNKVYWNLGNVAYGEKCNDGNWPTLKIKIRLKDNNTEGHLNTNYKIPADDQCILTYPDGDVRTPTPWLDRELPDEKATLTVRYVDEATGEEMGKVRETFDKNTYQPSGTTLYRKYSVTGKTNIIATFGLNYSMHELNTERVEVDGDDKYTTSSMPQTIFMDENKEVVFYYNIKEIEYGEAIARTFLVEKIDGKVQKIRTLKEAETIRLEMNVATKISAPTVSEATYLGNRVTNTRDVMTETALSTLNSDTSAWVKVTNEENPKYVDFVYESNVSSCMLMVRYLNEKG